MYKNKMSVGKVFMELQKLGAPSQRFCTFVLVTVLSLTQVFDFTDFNTFFASFLQFREIPTI